MLDFWHRPPRSYTFDRGRAPSINQHGANSKWYFRSCHTNFWRHNYTNRWFDLWLSFQGKGWQKTYWLEGREGLALPLLSSKEDENGDDLQLTDVWVPPPGEYHCVFNSALLSVWSCVHTGSVVARRRWVCCVVFAATCCSMPHDRARGQICMWRAKWIGLPVKITSLKKSYSAVYIDPSLAYVVNKAICAPPAIESHVLLSSAIFLHIFSVH